MVPTMNKLVPHLGSHVSLKSPEFFLGSVKEALSYGSEALMFYTGAPQNSRRLPLERLRAEEGLSLCKENGRVTDSLVVHAPYIINLAYRKDPDTYAYAKAFLLDELRRSAGFEAKILVLHPGSHKGEGPEEGIASLVAALDETFEIDGTDVKIAIETMAGKGNEVGRNLEEVAQILSLSKHPERFGVCMDTCHLNDAGYDLKDKEAFLAKVEETIGLKNVLVIHLNDSKNPIGAHKDRHENVGYGYIGFDTLLSYASDERFAAIPKILETPWVEEKPPYKQEISMLEDGSYVENGREAL